MVKTKILGKKKEIKPTKKWDNNIFIMLENYDRRKDVKQVYK